MVVIMADVIQDVTPRQRIRMTKTAGTTRTILNQERKNSKIEILIQPMSGDP
jgi:hypothetical protein